MTRPLCVRLSGLSIFPLIPHHLFRSSPYVYFKPPPCASGRGGHADRHTDTCRAGTHAQHGHACSGSWAASRAPQCHSWSGRGAAACSSETVPPVSNASSPGAAPSGSHGDAKGSRGRSPLRTCAARLPGIPWIPVGRTCFGNWREGHRARAKLMPRNTRSACTPPPPPHTRARTPDPQTHAHVRTRARTRVQTRSRLKYILAQAPQQTRAQTRRRCRSN